VDLLSGRRLPAGLALLAWLALAAGCAGGPGAGNGGAPEPGDPGEVREEGRETPAARGASDRLVERGREALEAGRLDEAAAVMERAVRVDPSNGRAYLGLARVRAAEGRPDAARGLLERAVDLLPDPDPGTAERIRRLRRALGEG
jgi:tetratricopeptide (TPR) repeat protein